MPTPALLDISGLHYLSVGPINLQLQAGECLCLSGESGCGKSRLLRAVADLDPHTGDIRLHGSAADTATPTHWRRQIGLLPAQPAWWGHVVGEHFAQAPNGELASVGLTAAILERDASSLSTGELQRLALLRLLQNQPAVLLLDEPTASVDPAGTRMVETVIAEYLASNNGAALWVSHDPAQIKRVGDRHIVLTNGALTEMPT